MVYGQFQMYTFWPWWTAKHNCMSETWWYIMGTLWICYEFLGSTVPKLARRSWLCFSVGLTFCMKKRLIYSVLIITMIRSFSSFAGSAVGLDVYKTILGHFKSLIRTMMSSGFCNTLGMSCFRFSVNFLYWYLASLCYYMLYIIYI